jgi:hypothetical protein
VVPYTRMFEVSLAAFVVSGAFLGRAYFDLWFEIVAGIVVLGVLYRRELAEEAGQRTKEAGFERERELSEAWA